MAVSRLLVTGALDLISNPVAQLRRTASCLLSRPLAVAHAPPRSRCTSTAAAAAQTSRLAARGFTSQNSHPVTAGYAASGVFRSAAETRAAAMLPAPASLAGLDPCGALASSPSHMVRVEAYVATQQHAHTTFACILSLFLTRTAHPNA